MVASPASSWMPACPSRAALKLRFSMRSASGLSCNISSHHFTVSSSSFASGTTVLTRPICSACCASYWRQRNQISFAFFNPTTVARAEAPKPPSKLPTRGPLCPERALAGVVRCGDVRAQHTVPPLPAADRVARDHRHHRLGQGADLLLQIEHVQARHAVAADVPLRAPDALVASRAECLIARAGEDGDAGVRVLAHVLEALLQLEQRLGAEGVADLGPVDGDL